jgi:hypothetical protein
VVRALAQATRRPQTDREPTMNTDVAFFRHLRESAGPVSNRHRRKGLGASGSHHIRLDCSCSFLYRIQPDYSYIKDLEARKS